jgi:5-methylcytosine-specific restriction endonuclease McrA
MVDMSKSCSKHGVTKHFERQDGSYRCGKCASSWVIENRRRKKQKLVNEFGGKCAVCGYKKYVGALDFHHINPKEKSFALSVKGLSYSWDSLLLEAKKCVVVCKNCHTEIEAGITPLP